MDALVVTLVRTTASSDRAYQFLLVGDIVVTASGDARRRSRQWSTYPCASEAVAHQYLLIRVQEKESEGFVIVGDPKHFSVGRETYKEIRDLGIHRGTSPFLQELFHRGMNDGRHSSSYLAGERAADFIASTVAA